MNRVGTLIVILLMLGATTEAESWKCSGSSGLRTELASLTLDLAWMKTNHALERSFLFLGACPNEFLEEMKSHPDTFSAWEKVLTHYGTAPEDTQRNRVLAAAVNAAQAGLPAESEVSARILYTLKAFAQMHPDGSPGRRGASAILIRQAIASIISDWPHSDGEFVRWLSDDLLFALALKPFEFAQAMQEHPSIFESWLQRLGSLSFTGLPEDKLKAEQFRVRLIKALETQPRSRVLDRVRVRLKEISFKSMD